MINGNGKVMKKWFPRMREPLTPTQQRMLMVLSDGLSHHRQDLHACLSDELSSMSTIRFHISKLRQKLPAGHAILCEIDNGTICYRWVRLIASSAE